MLSAAAGFIGMNVFVRSNASVARRPAAASAGARRRVPRRRGDGHARRGLALFGVAGYYGLPTWGFDVHTEDAVDALVGLGFGGSLISVFARLGGGIFTKGADVGRTSSARSRRASRRTNRATRP